MREHIIIFTYDKISKKKLQMTYKLLYNNIICKI